MNKKRTICVVSSSRADYNHLHKLMSNIKQSKKLKLQIVVTGMHLLSKYGLTYKEIINDGFVKSAHDISKGGVLVAITKMCISGKKGININKPQNLINYFEYFFGEDQGRYLIEIEKKDFEKVKSILVENSVYFNEFGTIQEKNVIL